MSLGIDKLVRLARLREDIAARAVARAEAGVRSAQAAVAEARARQAEVAGQVLAEKEALRSRFKSAPQAQVALTELLTDLRGKDRRTEEAAKAVANAEAHVLTAQEALQSARANVQSARRTLRKRQEIAAPLHAAARRAAEAAEEAEMAEQRLVRTTP